MRSNIVYTTHTREIIEERRDDASDVLSDCILLDRRGE